MKRYLLTFCFVLISLAAQAQILPTDNGQPCHFVSVYGYVGTAGQWANCLNSLQPLIAYTPVDQAGDTMQGPLGVTQLFGAGSHPAVSAGAGAGTSPTVGLSGTPHDAAFQLDVTTGSSPTGSNAAIATVTFASVYTQAPTCVWSPKGVNAAALSGTTGVYGVGSAGPPSTWTLNSGSAALTAATVYHWSVICVG